MHNVSEDTAELTQDKFKTLVGLAHDLQMPLKFMHDASYYIANNYDKLTKQQIIEYLEKINIQTEGFIHLIDGIVKGYSYKQSRLKLNLEPANMYQLVSDATSDLQHAARHYGQLLDVKSTRKLPLALVDKQALKLAIYNLTEMALKYSPTESSIIIKLSKRRDGLVLSLKSARLYITKPEIIRLLGQFGKMRSPTKTFASNSGMSVFVAKSIIEAMNGQFSLVKYQKGCSFNIVLPTSYQQPLFNLGAVTI